MKDLVRLAPALAPYRRRLAAGLAGVVASVGIGLVAPLLIGRAVDALGRAFSWRTIAYYAAAIVGVTAIQGVFSFLQRRILVGVSRDVELDLRNAYFRALELQARSFFGRHPTGDLMSRATSDLNAVRMLCGPAILYAAQTVAIAAFALSAMAWIDPGLTAIAVAILPLVAYVTRRFGARIHRLYEGVQRDFAALSARAQENFAGARLVRAYAQERAEEAAFGERNRRYVEGNLALARWTAMFHPLLGLLLGTATVAVLFFGGGKVASGALSLGELVSFLFFLAELAWPVIAIGWIVNLVERGLASHARLREVLEAVPAIVDSPAARPLESPVRGAIVARALEFRYSREAPPALSGVELSIQAGEIVGITGRTGSGKSTLLGLLARLHDPEPGMLSIDGRDVLDYRLEDLRASVALVPQETFLFSGSIADNIAFGAPAAPRRAIERLALAAGLGPDLERFPSGLDTLVGERGVTLSGGQKQRVAIARALATEARVLLFDDCLSAVDAETEAKILAHLESELAGRTVLVVAHRIATLSRAGRIVVLERGRLVESGTHRELLVRDGRYAELARLERLEAELAAV